MKKRLLLLFLILSGIVLVKEVFFPIEPESAGKTKTLSPGETEFLPAKHLISAESYPVFPLQLSLFPVSDDTADTDMKMLQLCDNKTVIPGLSLGLLSLNQKSSFVSVAPMNSIGKNHILQSSLLVSHSEDNYGLQLSPFCNLVLGKNRKWNGMQLGGVNAGGSIQTGLVNYSLGTERTLQFGLVNISEEGHGKNAVQFGLLNHNHESLRPYFPSFNFSMPWFSKDSAESESR